MPQQKRKTLRFLGLSLALSGVLFAQSMTEDQQILITSDAFHRGDFATAKKGYLQLYRETNNIIYAKEAAISAASLGDINTAVKLARLYKKVTKNNKDLSINKILVDGYIKTGQIQKAIALLEKIRKEDKSLMLDSVLGALYISEKQYTKAFDILSKLYNQVHDEDTLEKLITLYFIQNSQQEAADLITSHLEKYGCSPDLCQKSFNTLVQLNQLDKAKEAFSTLYHKDPVVQNAQLYIGVLVMLKEFSEAEKIAKGFPFNRRLLLDLYTAQKKFALASKQAGLLYKERKDPKFLALEAVYSYEDLTAQKKLNKTDLLPITHKLEKAIAERREQIRIHKGRLDVQDAFFYNFLGYSLIEYGLNVRKGIDYVKVALQIEPKSIFYIDSLAWGYFKLGNCALAKKLFLGISQEDINAQPELKAHSQAIAECQ
ncbi:tetratricopeptide repeat protein [Helicobacter ailurogastricus]|uniref:Putative lipoprotein n=1 Tax=Helicobacter ailurogastricus TaxID=1578720 RepID=A0A0K2Y777_9HELI|nr:ATP-dependent nuclease subunit B [Helicobacter ailurogastricus]CRF53000.1 Putative lipoprotein [Helicobacter ailurogastricus]